MVIYADDAIWRKPVPNQFWFAFNRKKGEQFCHFDVIKVKAEKSGDLIRKRSLLCKLLALKTDDRDADPEALITEIYHAAYAMKDELKNDQLLLIDRWVAQYKKIPARRADKIRKEIEIDFVETTISEHVFNQGKAEGEAKGKVQGQIEILEKLYQEGLLTAKQLKARIVPLRHKIKQLTA